jgi:hypothetical protein
MGTAMGIEVLLRTTDPLARTVRVAMRRAVASGLEAVDEIHHHDGSVRLVFERPAGKRFTVTLQTDGEIHAESFGAPRDTLAADLAVVEALLPGAKVVGTNPSWDGGLA